MSTPLQRLPTIHSQIPKLPTPTHNPFGLLIKFLGNLPKPLGL